MELLISSLYNSFMARKKTKAKKRLDAELLYSKIKYKHLLSEKAFSRKHPQATELLAKNGLLGPGKIRQHAGKLLASGVIAGTLLLAAPKVDLLKPPQTPDALIMQQTNRISDEALLKELAGILPHSVGPLSTDQETQVTHLLFRHFGVQAVPQLGSTRLNHVYGLIGAEQHLPRFPGDTVSQHDEHQRAGITPGLGAWGYFVRSKKDLTPKVIQMEKYYVAVQTLYLPDWRQRTRFLYNWYKYRKVAVANPKNGKVVVAVVADAGPSWWTGKHFGGSPEIMAYLGLNVGMQKGPVVMYFVDDPEDKVPLGPLEQHLQSSPVELAERRE
jgi:hypothetical protein